MLNWGMDWGMGKYQGEWQRVEDTLIKKRYFFGKYDAVLYRFLKLTFRVLISSRFQSNEEARSVLKTNLLNKKYH